MKQLGMISGCFVIRFKESEKEISCLRRERIVFHLNTNPGQKLLPLQKVAVRGDYPKLAWLFKLLQPKKKGRPH